MDVNSTTLSVNLHRSCGGRKAIDKSKRLQQVGFFVSPVIRMHIDQHNPIIFMLCALRVEKTIISLN